jgi:hypothetical protein
MNVIGGCAGIDPQIWRHLPHEIVFSHILPKCSIDTRLVFNIRPNKLPPLTIRVKRRLSIVPDIGWRMSDGETKMHIWWKVPTQKGMPMYDVCIMIYVNVNDTTAYWIDWMRGEMDVMERHHAARTRSLIEYKENIPYGRMSVRMVPCVEVTTRVEHIRVIEGGMGGE